MKINPYHPKLGLLLFSLGALIGLFFMGLAAWADFEAYLFDVTRYFDTGLPTLRCPIVVSPQETGRIRASVTNTTENKLTRRIRFHVSHGLAVLLREEELTFVLAPGETQKFEWKISSDDVVWERLILARVYLYSSYPLPSRSSACGVIVANVFNWPGAWIVAFAIVASLLSMSAGIMLRNKNNRPGLDMKRRFFDVELSMKTMIVVVALGILSTLIGKWVLGAILVIVATLMIVTVLAQSKW